MDVVDYSYGRHACMKEHRYVATALLLSNSDQ